MEKTLLLLSALLLLSCQSEAPGNDEIQKEFDEVVDIRIYSNGDLRFNGLMISDSSVPGHIKSLETGKDTRARVIIHENAPTGLVHKTQRLLHKQQVAKIKFETLSSAEFNSYMKNIIHIDVLNSGEILFDGKQVYPEDLKISLTNTEVHSSTEFLVSVSGNVLVGPVFDTLEELANINMTKIRYEDQSTYYHM